MEFEHKSKYYRHVQCAFHKRRAFTLSFDTDDDDDFDDNQPALYVHDQITHEHDCEYNNDDADSDQDDMDVPVEHHVQFAAHHDDSSDESETFSG